MNKSELIEAIKKMIIAQREKSIEDEFGPVPAVEPEEVKLLTKRPEITAYTVKVKDTSQPSMGWFNFKVIDKQGKNSFFDFLLGLHYNDRSIY